MLQNEIPLLAASSEIWFQHSEAFSVVSCVFGIIAGAFQGVPRVALGTARDIRRSSRGLPYPEHARPYARSTEAPRAAPLPRGKSCGRDFRPFVRLSSYLISQGTRDVLDALINPHVVYRNFRTARVRV